MGIKSSLMVELSLHSSIQFRESHMKRAFLSTIGLVTLLVAGSAMAADISAFRAASAAAPVYNWTGCYIGAHAGGIAYRSSTVNTWTDGGLIGGQLGCNYQIDHLVVGVEGEGAWSSADSTLTAATFGGAAGTARFKNEWDADIGVRFGLAYDRFLIYQKIGAMWSDNQFTGFIPGFGAGAVNLSGSVTSPGLFWGFGLEYGLTQKWTAKVETDFAHLAATDMNFSCAATPPSVCTGQTRIASINSFAVLTKLGLNYRW
jgi:outer membrane immunogenic protein